MQMVEIASDRLAELLAKERQLDLTLGKTPPLSKQQRAVREAILRLTRELGFCPSYDEIGRAMGGLSKVTILNHVEELERKGVVRRDKNKNRSLVVLK